jgi:hypothetical protein
MAHKVTLWIILAIALLLAVLSITFNRDALTVVVVASRFFEVMVPVLGVGALLKYLCCHGKCKCCADGKCDTQKMK